MYGETPYLVRGSQIDSKLIFGSDVNQALTRPVSLVGGYGVLPAGTIIGEITESTDRAGRGVPYAIQTTVEPALPFIGGAYIVTDGLSDTNVVVTMADSYKFAVGDHLGAVDSDEAPVDLEAIASIDRTSYSHIAVIVAGQNLTSGITVGNGGFVHIQTDTSTPFTTAKGFLLVGVDTGVGENAKGADGVIIVSHAQIRHSLILNYDAGALADFGNASVKGQWFYLT